MMVIVGGGAGIVLVVLVVIAFIICSKKRTSSSDSPDEKSTDGVGTINNTATTILQHVNGSMDKKSPISLKSSVVISNDHYQHQHPLQPDPPCFISTNIDNDSDTKEIDARTASSMSAGEADSTGYWENDQNPSPRTLNHHNKYSPSPGFNTIVSFLLFQFFIYQFKNLFNAIS